MKKALICIPCISDAHREKLLAVGKGCRITFKDPSELTQEDFDADYNAVIGAVPAAFLHGQPFELVQLASSGADAHVRPGRLGPDTVLCSCTGAYSQTVAEHALASTLMLLKKLWLYRDAQARHEWIDGGTVGTIDGATVIVMGLGEIGRYYARMAKALGAYVIGVRRRAGEKPDCVDEVHTMDDSERIIGRGDIIFSAMPGTTATTHFYTVERFSMMKPSAVFINCGRGTAVSNGTLYEVLTKGLISAAAVDVFETEPLPADSPLWDIPNLVITPHASGFFHLPATLERVVDICAFNLNAWLSGTELRNVIDPETGYRR